MHIVGSGAPALTAPTPAVFGKGSDNTAVRRYAVGATAVFIAEAAHSLTCSVVDIVVFIRIYIDGAAPAMAKGV